MDAGAGWGEGVMLEAGTLALEEVVQAGFPIPFGGASLGPRGRGVVGFRGDVMPIDVS